ncbi:aminoglycoside phosphotransferase family protein [Fictibacillus aquaticus]|uniref:Aminoglycoside phosphotransferase domain-containing protein n=1 Tax=Fictibacillus aquaticus TaxID=2021314 RepID=A0A235F606_9BACL|nr:aminoglycoside phosphotransferase family protein [Fictibacillus aquaticus]OYD56700.1 hypothetical protein CGZ90_16970 [Fictibacillus aquaticus]
MNLQFLFHEKIIEVQELSPGYDGHASDVWLVKIESGEAVVRSSRIKGEPEGDFWYGCSVLFGIDPRNVHQLESVNNVLSEVSSIPVPRVLKKGKLDREFVVVEKLEGKTVDSFIDQPASLLQSLGEGLARIHTLKRNYAGHPEREQLAVDLADFREHLANGMEKIVSRYYEDQVEIKKMLPEMQKLMRGLPVPESSTFVMIDLDPTQFISDGKVLTGLVDTEAYAIAPRELDFIGLEYILDKPSAAEFRKGYERVLPIPDLSRYRTPYRYLCRLLSIQGKVKIEKWMGHEVLF